MYCQAPKCYEMAGCSCGNENTQWSEFENHLWCDQCKKDFVPEHQGIFDGPIPLHLIRMFGMRFDRIIIATGKLEKFDYASGKSITPPKL